MLYISHYSSSFLTLYFHPYLLLYFFYNPLPSSNTIILSLHIYFFFFFNDTATTEIYTLSLHDALPISRLHLALLRLAQRAGDLLAGCLDQRGDGAAVLHLGQVIVARLQIQHAGFAVGQL